MLVKFKTEQQAFVHDKITKSITYLDTDTALAGGIYQLTVNERTIEVSTGGAGENFVVQLPPCIECAGLIFTVYMTARTTTDVTVRDYQTATSADTSTGDLGGADFTLALADQYTVLYSTGLQWIEIGENHA